jgi:transposase
MQSISTIGLDIAKSVFQVHGVDAAGQVVIRRQLRRRHVLAFFQKLPPCLVGMEALRVFAPLVPRAAGVGAYGAIDAADLCEALCQEAEPPSVFFDLRSMMHKCDQCRYPSRRK